MSFYNNKNFFPQYDLCCTIELLPLRKDINAYIYDPTDVTYNLLRQNGAPSRFLYNQQTNQVKFVDPNDPKIIQENWIYIDNVPQHIHSLCEEIIQQENFDIHSNNEFVAMSSYFEKRLKELCNARNKNVRNTYFVFLVPNRWSNILEKLKLVIVPLLKRAGVVFPVSSNKNLTFITELEAQISSTQLDPYKKSIPDYFQTENRCVMYNITSKSNFMLLSPVYFQLKEDDSLRVFSTDRYFAPKLLKMYDNREFTILDEKHPTLDKLILKNILKLETPIASGVALPKRYAEFETVDELLLSQILSLVKDYCINCTDFKLDRNKSYYDFTKDYLDSSQLVYIKSKEFLKITLDRIKKMFTTQIPATIKYMEEVSDDIPFIRKYKILCTENDAEGIHRDLTEIFFYQLQQTIELLYEDITPLTWDFTQTFKRGNPCFLQVARQVVISNMALKPQVIAEHSKLNQLCLPLHVVVDKPQTSSKTPDVIVYIDISVNLTHITCDMVDNNGVIWNKFIIEDPKIKQTLSSISDLFKSEMGVPIDVNKNFLQLVAKQKPKSTIKSRFKNTWKGMVIRNRAKTSRSSKLYQLQTPLVEYLKLLINRISLKLNNKNINMNKIGYVICMEKRLMDAFCISSRDEFLDLVKSFKLVDFTNNPRKLIVVDQGEKEVSKMFENNKLDPPMYYAHVHITDNGIYLKLKDVIDTTKSNGGVPESSIIYIKDRLIAMDSIYDQVADALWDHIQSLDEVERKEYVTRNTIDSSVLSLYKLKLKKFITDELFDDKTLQLNSDVLVKIYTLQLSKNLKFTLNLQQILNVAIFPVLKKITSVIVSSLVDKNVFGYYDVAKLFITGGFLKIKEYNHIYNWFIVSEMEKEITSQLRVKSHRTKHQISIQTSMEQKQRKDPKSIKNTDEKSFCYNIFLKGELRTVVSTTLCVCKSRNRHDHFVDIDEGKRFGHSTSFMLRGEEMLEKRHRVYITHGKSYYSGSSKRSDPYLMKVKEPSSIDGLDGPMTLPEGYQSPYAYFLGDGPVIHVEYLYYMSCIRLTIEKHDIPANRIETISYLVSERQAVKYF